MRITALVFLVYLAGCVMQAQTTTAPASTDEVALARSAAPAQISQESTVYVLRNGEYVKAVSGKGRFTCLVQRDDDPRSQYPVCMDAEWTRCELTEYLKEASLRKQGMSEAQIRTELEKLRRAGAIPTPHAGIAYMMSSKMRGMFSATNPDGRIQPHVMVYAAGVTNQQIGVGSVAEARNQRIPFVLNEGQANSYILVPMPKYTDGTAFENK